MKRTAFICFVSLSLAIGLAGCSKTESGSASVKTQEPNGSDSIAAISKEPVELEVFLFNSLTDEEIKRLWTEPVRLKHPNITFKFSRISGNGAGLEKELAAGHKPDILYYAPYIQDILDLDVPMDLRELMRKHQINLSGFDKSIVDAIQGLGPKGEIYSIPFVQNAYLMLYNKSVFDKFGQPYPKDGMMWTDVMELAKKVSRFDNGVQYRGIDPYIAGGIHRLGFPMSIHYFDAAANKAFIDPKWRNVFQLAMDIYGIPNNRPEKLADPLANDFLKNQVVAMLPEYNTRMNSQLPALSAMNWDIAQFPSYPDYPNVGIQVDYHQFVVSKTSKYPDQAMQAISVFISDQVQLDASRIGRIPASTKVQAEKEYGSEVPEYKGKNIAAMFKSKNAPFPKSSPYDTLVRNEIVNAFKTVFDGTDINTALRVAEDKANQAITAEIQRKK
jgi:multiple sugar transport system substrate-binding protein